MKSLIFEKTIAILLSFEDISPKRAAVIYIFASSFLFAIMNIFVKLCYEIPTYQIIYSRGIINIFLCYIVLINTNDSLFTKDSNTNKLLTIRGIMGGIALGLYFHALKLLPLSTANILMRMNPLWVGIIGAIFYKENFGLSNLLVMITSFTGIIMIIKPDFIWGRAIYKNDSAEESTLGVFMCLINGILSALIMLTIGQLKGKVNVTVLVFYFNFFNIMFAGVGLFYEKTIFLNWNQVLKVLAIGFLGWGAQLFRSRALFLEKAFFISIISYNGIILSYLTDVFILNTEIDGWSNIGGLVVFLSILFLIIKEKKTGE